MKYLLYICLILPLSLRAQVPDKEKLDAFLDRIESEDQGMGSLSIFRDGEEIYQRSIGYADTKKRTAAGPATVYRIGSISKIFTAAIILQLTEENLLSLETPLADYYPGIPNAEKITIEHLLRHRSGLYNFTNAEDYPSYMESPMSPPEMIELFTANGTVFEPGEKFEYSNTNYVLLSFIIEKATGHPYPEVLYNRIARPCGLAHTYYGGPIGEKDGEAFSYKYEKGWSPSTETDMSLPQGAGAIVSTAGDINRFMVSLFGGKLISGESLDKMIDIQDRYGLGLMQFPFGEKKAFGHGGGIDAFQSLTGYFREEKVAITYLSNGVRYPLNSIMIGALSILFDEPFEIPEFNKVSPKILDRYVGTYTSPEIPIDLKIFREGDSLYGQGTGQPSFMLTSKTDTTFTFDPAGVTIEFKPDEDSMIFTQGGQSFVMTRTE